MLIEYEKIILLSGDKKWWINQKKR
jgi:hypothetical protein